MKTLLIILMLAPSIANAGPYVSFNAGLAILENHELHFEEHTYKPGIGITGALGYDFGYFRAEIEAVQTWNDQDTTYDLNWNPKGVIGPDISKRFYFVNGLVDIPIYGDIEAFLGAGYGFPRYQLLAGFKYNLSEKWAVSLGYRFIHEPYDAREYTVHPVLGAVCGGFPGGICSGPEPIYENHLTTVGVTYYFW